MEKHLLIYFMWWTGVLNLKLIKMDLRENKAKTTILALLGSLSEL